MAFVGVDWGTTGLRAYLLGADGAILETLEEAGSGTLAVYSSGGGFAKVLDALFVKGTSPAWRAKETIVLLCGMVGSRQGWQEVPYVPGPATIAEVAKSVGRVDLIDGRVAFIVPGISHKAARGGAPDVMRGEETQLFGSATGATGATQERLFLLPGTHSKWAHVCGKTITSFETRMTGEVFDVLSKHSILGKLMDPAQEDDWRAFEAGLIRSGTPGGLLAHIFTCRTEALAATYPPSSLSSYLSGILVGHELRDGMQSCSSVSGVTLVGSSHLCERYRRAFVMICGVEAKVMLGHEAVATGLWNICQELHRSSMAIATNKRWCEAVKTCPIVAILRGLEASNAVAIGQALVSAGIKVIEVPLNSPDPFTSIKLLADSCPVDVVVGAGTVLTPEDVDRVAAAGGKVIVSPNTNEAVIRHTKALGLISVPGAFTPTEAFQAIQFGSDAVKAFPGDDLPPLVLRAWRAVLPKSTLLMPTGGVTVDNMADYLEAGVNGFGVGSSIFKPTDSPDQVQKKADSFVLAHRDIVARRIAATLPANTKRAKTS
jgi:2-dehydro-3-deoxyphosphogalactonate aldolase